MKILYTQRGGLAESSEISRTIALCFQAEIHYQSTTEALLIGDADSPPFISLYMVQRSVNRANNAAQIVLTQFAWV